MSVGAMEKAEPELIRVVKPEKRPLLERYDIPVEHLSYEYISECTNGKILERILLILRSGEEGVYPDLTRHAEERLAKIKPHSVILRKVEPILKRNMLNPEELKQIDNDIKNWTSEMQFREKDLEESRSILTNEPLPHPDIRQTKEELANKKVAHMNKNREKTKRISSCDYAAWDKFDADTEINKIQIREEQRTAELKRAQKMQKELNERKRAAESMIINRALLTGTELDIMAEQAREKGNEAFRAGDYEEALEHYDSSIKIDSNLLAYNNRAMTLIKLQRYEDALNDCNVVLQIENTNIKALLRRAVALEHLKESVKALGDYETVLKLEPTNKIAIAGAKKLRKPCESKKVRMTIEEVNDANEESANDKQFDQPEKKSNDDIHGTQKQCVCFCDRAPGPSRNVKPRPHLKTDYCLENQIRLNSMNEIKVAYDVRKQKSEHKRDTLLKNPSSPKSVVTIEELPAHSSANEQRNVAMSESRMRKPESDDRFCNNKKHDLSKKSNLNEKKSNLKVNAERDSYKSENCQGKLPSPNKVRIADKYQNKTSKPNKDNLIMIDNINNINNAYEFTRVWQSLKDDVELKVHAQVLRSLTNDDLNKGNKLDGKMFSTILRCLERHFCTLDDVKLLNNLLKSLSQVNRFSIVSMFSNAEDKEALKTIFSFLKEQGTPDISLLQEVYCSS